MVQKNNKIVIIFLCILSILCSTFASNNFENLDLKDVWVTPYWHRFYSKNIKVFCEGEKEDNGEDFRFPVLSARENNKIIYYFPRTNYEGWCEGMLLDWKSVITTSDIVYISGFYLGSTHFIIDKIRTNKSKWSYFVEEGKDKVGLRDSQS